jgi:hypothetical protein
VAAAGWHGVAAGANPLHLGVALAATGFLIWVGLSVIGGFSAGAGFRLREAWDTAAYFYVGLPLMALAVGAASFVQPERPWRWPLWLVGGHQLGVLLLGVGMQSGLSLLLLTLMLGTMLAAVFAVPALLAANAARRRMERAYY